MSYENQKHMKKNKAITYVFGNSIKFLNEAYTEKSIKEENPFVYNQVVLPV